MYDVADEIPELKDLIDDGILTQEEFDTRQKQLLGNKNKVNIIENLFL